MSRVNYFLLFGLVLLPFIKCGSLPYQKYYKNNEYRRVGLNNNDKESSPAFYPVYNHHNNTHNSVQDMTSTNEQTNNGYHTYQSPPTAIQDEKSNSYIPPSTSYGVPDTSHSSYGPPTNYGPMNTYPTYESPNSYPSSPSVPSAPSGSGYTYTPPNNYGPPSVSFPTAPGSSSYYPNSYMPPPPAPQYGPPTGIMETVQKGHEGFIEKLIKKIDLVLMSKALLKLIIFKKIIKFIAVICLLMFIPVLKKKFEESAGGSGNEDEERKSKLLDSYADVDFRVKEVANFALTAIEAFESHDIRWCVGESEFYCRLQYMLDAVDLRFPGNRMLKLWFPQLETTSVNPETSSIKTTTAYPYRNEVIKFNDYITKSPNEMSSIENDNEEDNFVKK
ncbi:unnamed protein product [Chironomus riparius]|uniref:Uncharacterized protein n=1 Tax=Chironomus riparius TaxID=315576 RepID=A0A9P0NL96_9DIPT|nr:unnamed protein product [Chironomus riparius]